MVFTWLQKKFVFAKLAYITRVAIVTKIPTRLNLTNIYNMYKIHLQ